MSHVITEHERGNIDDLFEKIITNVSALIEGHKLGIFQELKENTEKAITAGEDFGKLETIIRIKLDSGGIMSRHRESIEYTTTRKVKQELDAEVFDPMSPDLFDRDGNANPEILPIAPPEEVEETESNILPFDVMNGDPGERVCTKNAGHEGQHRYEHVEQAEQEESFIESSMPK